MTDPQLQQEVATVVGRHPRAKPTRDNSVGDGGIVFVAAMMRTAELAIPPQERKGPGQG